MSRKRSFLKRWRLGIMPWLMLALCGLILPSCATSSTQEVLTVCEKPQIPETVLKSGSEDVKDYSRRVSDWLERVRSFLAE